MGDFAVFSNQRDAAGHPNWSEITLRQHIIPKCVACGCNNKPVKQKEPTFYSFAIDKLDILRHGGIRNSGRTKPEICHWTSQALIKRVYYSEFIIHSLDERTLQPPPFAVGFCPRLSRGGRQWTAMPSLPCCPATSSKACLVLSSLRP